MKVTILCLNLRDIFKERFKDRLIKQVMRPIGAHHLFFIFLLRRCN
ncbi:hypothetical protein HMPREF9372_2039 [Sporosarcina newyorkensis 2681]|uniref:Uncharacterized protein n=1 Tax=Sporosarcina newyorkensis 2681 TaxID=1027292 RepID=F9DTA8_9BACL|nr:hypothetical protein HMPREF9372_2039 [Sporosarcina newyorkensis 2681]